MRAIVCGSRDLTDPDYVFRVLDGLRETMGLSHVIEGGQRRRSRQNGRIDGGADYWAMRWAKARGLTWDTVDADWTKHGRAAGPMRNARMLSEFAPEAAIAFPGGSGTSDMMRRAERARVQVISIRPNGSVDGQHLFPPRPRIARHSLRSECQKRHIASPAPADPTAP